MNRRLMAVSLAVLLVCCVRASAQDAAPSYVMHIRPFLNRYCVECHKTGTAKGGANLESYASIMKGGKKGRTLLVAGKPDDSRIVTTTEGAARPTMPPRKAKAHPTEKEVALLRAWVKAGAKDDTPADTEARATGIIPSPGDAWVDTRGRITPFTGRDAFHRFTTPLRPEAHEPN